MSYFRYEAAKAAWLRANPNATQAQIEAAFKRLAKSLGV